jgi:hypothetical protein
MTNPCSYSAEHSIDHKTRPTTSNVFRVRSLISFCHTRSGDRPHGAKLPGLGSARPFFVTAVIERDEQRGISFAGLSNSRLRAHPTAPLLRLLVGCIATILKRNCDRYTGTVSLISTGSCMPFKKLPMKSHVDFPGETERV